MSTPSKRGASRDGVAEHMRRKMRVEPDGRTNEAFLSTTVPRGDVLVDYKRRRYWCLARKPRECGRRADWASIEAELESTFPSPLPRMRIHPAEVGRRRGRASRASETRAPVPKRRSSTTAMSRTVSRVAESRDRDGAPLSCIGAGSDAEGRKGRPSKVGAERP